ncbi:hypothetical protein HC766_04810 [Candidatus Gracilibacteria bacterium]|nr:hypothetical protein [Candidatus Gracilibacteria bacterium]
MKYISCFLLFCLGFSNPVLAQEIYNSDGTIPESTPVNSPTTPSLNQGISTSYPSYPTSIGSGNFVNGSFNGLANQCGLGGSLQASNHANPFGSNNSITASVTYSSQKCNNPKEETKRTCISTRGQVAIELRRLSSSIQEFKESLDIVCTLQEK